jgi:hypothetical protein
VAFITIITLSGIMSCGMFQSQYYDPKAPFMGILGGNKGLEHNMLQQIHSSTYFTKQFNPVSL